MPSFIRVALVMVSLLNNETPSHPKANDKICVEPQFQRISRKPMALSFWKTLKPERQLKIKINDKPRCEITPLLRRTIKAAFLQRRKNIKNSLQNAGFLNVEEALKACGFDIQIRGEKLSIQDFYNLSKALYKYNNEKGRRAGIQLYIMKKISQ